MARPGHNRLKAHCSESKLGVITEMENVRMVMGIGDGGEVNGEASRLFFSHV